MRLLSRTKALLRLDELRERFRAHIGSNYEHRAKSCATCKTKGACCLDEHFVNVRISRLEAEAIDAVIDSFPLNERLAVLERVRRTAELLAKGQNETYACPLYDREAGCTVHKDAKPSACIAHACYEDLRDLPPDHLLTEQESLIEELNLKAYGRHEPWLPIPIAIKRMRPTI